MVHVTKSQSPNTSKLVCQDIVQQKPNLCTNAAHDIRKDVL